ncbi:MAG: ATP-binding cassette domain-containing protein [Promethearchaeota archaeon]
MAENEVNSLFFKKTQDYLDISAFANQILEQYSGGELQRFAIASVLIKEADIYIIDELSAYLDVEERIHIDQIIRTITRRNNAVVICIESDIQIADALIDRVLLFSGKSGVYGNTIGSLNNREGMNLFLKENDVVFRRDTKTGRTRLNKRILNYIEHNEFQGNYSVCIK